ncbi:MAG: DUF4347 domain-containing protein [Nostoc sp.]|uniref:DUF4347 domain-containing protein n=1 Tax=Nostoc sp. TaxID=1180 RepID=UPI002FEE6FC2
MTSSLTGLGRSNQSLLFVDRSVTDYEQLLAGVTTGTEIHVLDPGQDAVTQITNTLLGRQNIASLHIVSHGEAGGVDFGSNALKLTDLPQYAAQLKTWSKALTNDADILFYGCNVAEGQLGQAFVQNISQLTGADVAASDDLTGNSALGGDWELEINTGSIESLSVFSPIVTQAYGSVLGGSDSFSSRTVLTGGFVTDTGSNVAATAEAGEPDHAGLSNPNKSVWWTWTAPSSGTYEVNTVGSNFDSTLGVYTGSTVSSLTTIGSNDDSPYGLPSQVIFSATAGTAYQVAVSGYQGNTGSIGLQISGTTVGVTAGTTPVENSFTNGTFNLNVSNASPNAVTVNYSLAGNAIQGSDYTLVAGTNVTSVSTNSFVLAAGATSATLIAAVINDSTPEPNETIQLTLTGGLSYTLATSSSSTLTIAANDNNAAPTLTGNATLAEVAQNTTNPSGSTLSSLFGSLFSDPDTGASLSGLAIVGNTATTQGRWEYSTDGTNWASVGAVADDATALALSATTLVRFVPLTGYNGTPPGLTVRALDNSYSNGFTNGTIRVTVNTTSNGGTTAIAATTVLLDTSVTQSLSNLLWRNSDTGENVVWQLNDFAFQSGYSLAKVSDPNWEIADTADFNADGIADILWRNKASGENVIWEMNNTGYETGHSITQVSDPNWQIAGTADFNADGTSDILWRNKASGENAIWEMDGFSVQTGHSITQVSDPNWQIADTADFNADGIADILWRNKANGENAIWEMNGFSVQTGHSITQVSDPNWQIAGTGDFNADGTSDILWRNKASGENVIWEMNDFSLQTSQLITQVSDPNWQIAGVADLGSDSTPEILWYNKPTGNQVIWEMSSLTNPQPYQLPNVSNPNWSVKPAVPVKPFVPA